MLVSEARTRLGDSVLFRGSSFSNAERDRPLQSAMDYWLVRVQPDNTIFTATITAGTATLDLSSTQTWFRKEHLHHARIGNRVLNPAGIRTALRKLDQDSKQAKPTMVALETATSLYLYPTPDAAYTLTVVATAPVASLSWTVGSTGASTIDLATLIADEYMNGIIWFGASAMLVYGEVPARYQSEEWQFFLQHVNDCRRLVSREPVTLTDSRKEQ